MRQKTHFFFLLEKEIGKWDIPSKIIVLLLLLLMLTNQTHWEEPETSSSYSELTMIFFRMFLIKIYFLYRIWFFFFLFFLSPSTARSLARSLFLHRIHSLKIYVKMNQKYCAIRCFCDHFLYFYFDSFTLSKSLINNIQTKSKKKKKKCPSDRSWWRNVFACKVRMLLIYMEMSWSQHKFHNQFVPK